MDHLDDILHQLGERPGIFTDYDGTLTPIVDDPARAILDPEVRGTLRRLASVVPLAVVSGRDVRDVRELVGLPDLVYAGSHGFEIIGPDLHVEQEDALELLPVLDAVEKQLCERLDGLPGVSVERKRFAVAVHTRRAHSQVERRRAGEIAREVSGMATGLELQTGKEILEFRPAVEWDKGRAISFLVDVFAGIDTALYLGDDTTDEDAFRQLRRVGGLGIRVDDDPGETAATYVLRDTEEASGFLARLATHLCAPDAAP